jgi:flagellar biosynthesis protein FlhF
MNVKTYRANTMQEALALVRREMGPKASVLRTREVRGGGLLKWLGGSRMIEVVASTTVTVPSRLPSRRREAAPTVAPRVRPRELPPAARAVASPPAALAARAEIKDQLGRLRSQVDGLCRPADHASPREPGGSFRLLTDLIDADVNEDVARELVERVRRESPGDAASSASELQKRLALLIEATADARGPAAS